MFIGVQSSMNPDMGFVVEVNERIEEAKELIKVGFEAWFAATDDYKPNPYYTEEDLATWYDMGYAEPSVILLDRNGIPHSDVYTCFDEDGEFVKPWDEAEIYWVY